MMAPNVVANGDAGLMGEFGVSLTNILTAISSPAKPLPARFPAAGLEYHLQAAGRLDPDFFKTGAAATDANDHIVYHKTSGALFYDPDGNGSLSQIQFATLENKPTINATGFFVI